MNSSPDYSALTPDLLLNAVEKATDYTMTGLTSPLPSYINRVYELQAADGTRLIAKFYRPGRWNLDALKEEHDFLLDCAEDEIPVVPPIQLSCGGTIGDADGIFFSVFPKKLGREMEINSDEDWKRMGRLLGRIHVSGSRRSAPSRIRLHPLSSTASDINHLIDGGFVSPGYLNQFRNVTNKIVEISERLFDDIEFIRLHGDCHLKNFLYRPDEGIMAIDFDDMVTGPPVQDLWLLLPDYAHKTRREFNLLLEGYEQFREYDDRNTRLIEPLRAMRIIYFLAWCSKQSEDYRFRTTFPNWGSETFWLNEVKDLRAQLEIIKDDHALPYGNAMLTLF